MSQGIGTNKERDDRDEILAHGQEPRRTLLAPGAAGSTGISKFWLFSGSEAMKGFERQELSPKGSADININPPGWRNGFRDPADDARVPIPRSTSQLKKSRY